MESCALAASTIEQARHEPIRLLHVIPMSSSKASMIFARRQVAALEQAGVTCETFMFEWRTFSWNLVREWRRLRKTIGLFRPDVIHAHYGTLTALLAALSAPVALVVTYRGSDLNPSPGTSWVRWLAGRLLSQLAALRARQIICVSGQLRERLWWRKHRAVVIPTGVDTGAFYPQPRDEARTSLGWTNRERVVLFNAGGNSKVKRLDLAQAAVDKARAICGELRFVVLKGETAPESVPLLMNAADCLLVTSDCEGSPTVVQEAMACNLPVVSVDVGDVRQRLEGVSPSRIVARDSAEVGTALAEILTQGRRSNGNMRVRDFSNTQTAPQIISLYRAVLGKRSLDESCSRHF